MKRHRMLKRMALLMIAVVFMVSTQSLTAKADLYDPTTVYGFLNAIDKNYGGELNTLTYYADYAMLLSDWGIGETTYYLQVTGRQEKFYEVLEDGIQSIEFVTTTDALLNDPEEKTLKLFEVAVVQAEESLFSEEDALALQGFLSRDEIIANAERLIELGKDGRIIASQGPRWGAEIIIRRNDFDIPVGDKFDIHIFRLARNVKFIPEEPVVSVGETQKLNVEIENLTPDAAKVKKLTWLSDNPSILTVDQNGNIKGISKGEAVVSVPIVDNGSPVFSNVKVRVIAGVKKIELAEKKIDLLLCNDEEKGKARLTYTYEPEDANDPTVKWSSSNEKVATVDEFGNVQAIGTGNAKITATSNGPQNHKKPASAICNVSVKQGVTEISLSEQSLTLMTGKRARLQVSYMPQNAANKKAVWKSSDETVAKVDGNGNITAVSKGSAMIICTVADDSDVSASCTVNVSDSLPAEDTETVETVQNEKDQAGPELLSARWSEEDKKVIAEFRKNNVQGQYQLWECFDRKSDENISGGGYEIQEDNGEDTIEVRQGMLDAIPGETLSIWIKVTREDGTVVESNVQEIQIPITNAVSPITVTACNVEDLDASVLEKLYEQVAEVYYNEGYDALKAIQSKYYRAAVNAEFITSDSVTVLMISPNGMKHAFFACGKPDVKEGDYEYFNDSLASAFAFRRVPIMEGQYTLRIYDTNERCLIGTWYFNVKD